MSQVKLNEMPVVQCGYLNPIYFNNLEITSCKNAGLKEACQFYGNSAITAAIQTLAGYLTSGFKYVLVDVKLHDLIRGEYPCLPGWHIDGGPATPSEYVLCVAGVSRTEFNDEQLSLPSNPSTKLFCQKLDAKLQDRVTARLQDWQIVKYNHLTPHRGAAAFQNGKRFLIRVMGSNRILPQPIGDWEPLVVRK